MKNIYIRDFKRKRGVVGWCDSAMVLGKLSVPGRPTNLDNSRAGPNTLAADAGGGC